MRLALRPYVTAGVAIVGASVIAVTPITPTPTQPRTQSHAVQLSAAVQTLDAPSPFGALPSASALGQPAVAGLMAGSSFENPIARWMEVFQTTSASLTALLNAAGTNPFPVVRQIIANQTAYANTISAALTAAATGVFRWLTVDERANLPASLRLIAQYLAQGNVTAVGDQINFALTDLGVSLFGLLDLLEIPYQISRNVANVLQTLVSQSLLNTGILGKTGFGLLTTLQTAIRAVSISGQALVDAGRAGDPLAALSAIVNAPAEFVDAVLNGIPNRFGRRVGGLLGLTLTGTSWSLGTGLFVLIPRLIAAAITPPTQPAVASIASTELVNDVAALPSADAQTISLDAGSPTEVDAVASTTAEETSGETPETDTGTKTSAVTEESPEPESPATDVVDETEGTDETDGTDETEGSEETTGTDEADDSEESNGPKSPNGSTDLSGGNKAVPGKSGTGTNAGSGSGADSNSPSTDETANPTTGSNTSTGAGNTNSGNDAGGSNNGSDGGSDS